MKNETSIVLLGSLFFFSTFSVLLLVLNTNYKPSHQHSSFSRILVSDAVVLANKLDMKYNSYYIAGATGSQIYFGNRVGARHLLLTDIHLADTQHVELTIDGHEGLEFRSITLQIDSPYFYWSDGSVPAIFRGTLDTWHGSRYTYDSAYFMESIPINSTSFAIRTINSRTKEVTLGKEMNVIPHVQLAPNLLEKQIDGKLCVDGMMHYAKDLNWLVYVYYYRNQFICTDTSLNLIYRGATIDTISRAKIKVAKIHSENAITMAAPALTVNKKSSVSGNWLFINSNLLSRNEDKKAFEGSSVIDVYDLTDGKYRFSFYLPKHNDLKLREFKVFGDMLIALYDHYIIKYHLNSKYLLQ